MLSEGLQGRHLGRRYPPLSTQISVWRVIFSNLESEGRRMRSNLGNTVDWAAVCSLIRLILP